MLHGRRSRAELRAALGLPDRPLYYVAIAIVETETEGLFASIEEGLASGAGPAGASHFLVKTHPNRPAGDEAMRRAMESLGTGRSSFVPPDGNMYEYLAASDAMICIGSTVAFEAMALGVMPVVYEHPGTFAATSLRAFEAALYVVSSPAALREALDEIAADGPGARARRASWAEALAQVFGDLVTPLQQQLDAALTRLGVPGAPAVN
jgi:hypothetical protein